MAFFKRVIDHVLNQVLVEGLANSRWFQRFAVWSNNALKDITEKNKNLTGSAEPKLSSFFEAAKQQTSKFRQEFQEELRKLNQQQSNLKR